MKTLVIFSLFTMIMPATKLLATTDKVSSARIVKMYKVGKPSTDVNFSYPAVVQAATSTQLSFQMAGKIVDLKVTQAQAVKKGDVIARIDQVILRNEVNAARSAFTVANSDYKRAQRLIKGNAISQKELERRRNEKVTAYDRLKSAKKKLNDSTLVAPFDGIITQVPVEVSQTVSGGQEIATLIDNTKMDAVTNIPARIVSRVKQREGAKATVVLDAASDTPIPAEFSEAKLQADLVTQTYEVSFRFSPPTNLVILPGMNASVSVMSKKLKSDRSGVTVPIASIFYEAGKNFVWVVNGKNQKVKKTQVKVGKAVGEFMPILTGLKHGDVVVGAGVSYLSEGTRVKAWDKAEIQ